MFSSSLPRLTQCQPPDALEGVGLPGVSCTGGQPAFFMTLMRPCINSWNLLQLLGLYLSDTRTQWLHRNLRTVDGAEKGSQVSCCLLLCVLSWIHFPLLLWFSFLCLTSAPSAIFSQITDNWFNRSYGDVLERLSWNNVRYLVLATIHNMPHFIFLFY